MPGELNGDSLNDMYFLIFYHTLSLEFGYYFPNAVQIWWLWANAVGIENALPTLKAISGSNHGERLPSELENGSFYNVCLNEGARIENQNGGWSYPSFQNSTCTRLETRKHSYSAFSREAFVTVYAGAGSHFGNHCLTWHAARLDLPVGSMRAYIDGGVQQSMSAHRLLCYLSRSVMDRLPRVFSLKLNDFLVLQVGARRRVESCHEMGWQCMAWHETNLFVFYR